MSSLLNIALLAAAPLFSAQVDLRAPRSSGAAGVGAGAYAELTETEAGVRNVVAPKLACSYVMIHGLPDMIGLGLTRCASDAYVLTIYDNSWTDRAHPGQFMRSGLLSFPGQASERAHIVTCTGNEAAGTHQTLACADQGPVPTGLNPNPAMGVSN